MQVEKSALILFFVFILLGLSLKVQTNESIKKVYTDLSIGGMIASEGIGFNAHLGVGYQFSSLVGVGVGWTASININDFP